MQSVLAQTFKDYEHIIVDDSNESHTDQIIEEFKDERIILHKHSVRKGAAGGYNSGIKLARGEYILFLDDDDEYLPEFLNTIYDFFISTGKEIGFVWTGISIVRDSKKGEVELLNKIWPVSFPDKQSELVAATTIGNGYGLCIRKECIEITGLYDESILMGHDADFLFRLVRYFNFKTIPRVLVKIHHHIEHQLTDKKNDLMRLRFREKILAGNMDLIDQYSELYRIHFRQIAELSYGLGLRTKGRLAIRGILQRFPFSIRDYADWFAYEISGKDLFDALFIRKFKRLILNAG